MNGTRQSQETPVPSDELRAEAAAWIARLHDEQRQPDLEARVHAWLARSEDHRRAFNRMTHVWERTSAIRMRARGDMSAKRTVRWRFHPWAVALAATVIFAAVILVCYRRDNAVMTAIGQQQVRMLPDGTRVVLNTDTRIEVNYDEHARRVRLIRGEAWFDVSKRPTWPFLVSVDGREIRALGTSFIVRHDDIQDLSVTLVEGRISVSPIARSDESPPQDPQILAPGQRLLVSHNHKSTVDRPELTRITAWERGRVEFDETPLGDAASEMNRYSTSHVTAANAEVAQLRIGGVFRAGDSDEFVRIVTAAFGLKVDRRGHDIVLSQAARPPASLPPPLVVPQEY
jgi:transmembrane sensor